MQRTLVRLVVVDMLAHVYESLRHLLRYSCRKEGIVRWGRVVSGTKLILREIFVEQTSETSCGQGAREILCVR